MYDFRELLVNVQKSYVNRKSLFTKQIENKVNTIKSSAITFLLHYSKFATKIQDKYKYVYDNNVVVKLLVDQSFYWVDYVYSFLIRKKIEPFQSYWISSSVLSKRDKNRYIGEEFTLLESYEFIKDPNVNCETSYNEICDAVDSIVLNSQSYIEGLVKMKLGDNYIYRMFDSNNGLFKEFNLPLVPSKTRFLSIVYFHPLMKKTIFITLDKSVYFVDNQIPSPTFVKLYLEYQPEFYHFDMDYVVKIMDNDINTLELTFDKSILLTEDGYKIV